MATVGCVRQKEVRDCEKRLLHLKLGQGHPRLSQWKQTPNREQIVSQNKNEECLEVLWPVNAKNSRTSERKTWRLSSDQSKFRR